MRKNLSQLEKIMGTSRLTLIFFRENVALNKGVGNGKIMKEITYSRTRLVSYMLEIFGSLCSVEFPWCGMMRTSVTIITVYNIK